MSREGHRVRLRGHARPVFRGSPNDPGVVTTEAKLVVEYPEGHCERRSKTAFRMRNDGSLVVPPGAPPFK